MLKDRPFDHPPSQGFGMGRGFCYAPLDGAFPNARAMEEDGGMEEERRLFYVACTRARKNLFSHFIPWLAGERWATCMSVRNLFASFPTRFMRNRLAPRHLRGYDGF